MGDLSLGQASGYPAALDTNSNPKVLPTLTDHLPAEGACNGVIAIETEMGVAPEGSKLNVQSRLSVEHDADGLHTLKTYQAFVFFEENPTDTPGAHLIYISSGLVTGVVMPYAGSIIGLAALKSATPDDFAVQTRKNGGAFSGGITIFNGQLSGTITWSLGAYPFVAGDYLGVQLTKTDVVPDDTVDICVTIIVAY